jgi:hypothetical protein
MHQSLRFIAHRSNTAQHVSGSSCPSSGAYQLQQQPLVYRWNVVVAVSLVVVWPVVYRTDHYQRNCYHHVPTVNQRRLLQFINS